MKILLEAPILTSSGYGEHSRLVFKSLLEHSDGVLDIYVNPLEWGTTSWITEDSPTKQLIDRCILNQAIYMQNTNNQPSYDIQIHVGIPNEFKKKAPYSVCVTAGIESTRVSPEWILRTYQGIDKIIVPSEHSKQGFLNAVYPGRNQNDEEIELSCQAPIDVVPYPVKIHNNQETLNINFDTDFNFLMVAMWGIRKNIENSVRWFIEEFRNEPSAGLVIKTGMSKNSILDRARTKEMLNNVIKKCGDKKCKIYLIHGNLSESEIHSLYLNEKIKVFLSATHGEGYGLPIFEAAYSGLPIVATDWSGHLDFLSGPIKTKKNNKNNTKNTKLFSKIDYRLGPIQEKAVWKDILIADSQWAYPIETSFKNQIRNIYRNYGPHLRKAKFLKENILKTHEEKEVTSLMAEALIPDRFRPNSETSKWISELEEMVNV